SPLLAAGTSLLMFYFAQRLFSASAGLWTVLALNVTPIFNIGAFLMTIDSLSVFFWLAAMFTSWLALERSPRFSWHWPLTGLLVGLGFLSKYTNALELVSIMLVLVLARRLRQEFARPGLYLLLGVFGLCTIPPIVWNTQHAWITLTHLRSRGGIEQGFGFHPLEAISFLGEHFLAYSPFLFLALDTDLLRTAGVELQRNDPSDRMRGWKSATRAVEKTRNDLEAKLGEKLFLIADARDRASEISFYLRDKRPEGPNHPPVYITESQDMV